jgi:hypothetical protein
MAIDIMRKTPSSDFHIDMEIVKLHFSCRCCRTIYSIIFLGFCIYCPQLYGAFEKKDAGASSFSLGNAAVAIDEFLFALYYNPAAISTSKGYQMAFTVQNYFGVSDLNEVDLTTCFSFAGHPISFAINRFGERRYQEIQITTGSRFEIFKNCALGFSVQCYILSIKGYGQALAWGANFAVLYKIHPEISIGSLVTNINRPTISRSREQLPRTMSIGFSYFPATDLMIAVDLFQDTHFDQELRVGCSYQVMPYFAIRIGVEDRFNIYCYGLGLNINWIMIDYSLRTHPVLGISHIATFSIAL